MTRARAYATIALTARFERSYRRLSRQVQIQCDDALLQLVQDPLAPGLHLKPIRPGNRYFEARINRGDRLVIFPVGTTAYIMDVICHDDIERWGTEAAPARPG